MRWIKNNIPIKRLDKMQLWILWLNVFFFLLAEQSTASDFDLDKLSFSYIHVEDGLSHYMVSTILEDSNGYMWFGTENGLNRYNGYEIEQFFYDPLDENSLSDNFIKDLVETSDGVFWIAANNGLTRYDPKTDRFQRYYHDPNNPKSLPHNTVTCLLIHDSGELWLGTLGGGLARFNKNSDDFTVFKHNPNALNTIANNQISAIAQDKKGSIWIGFLDSGGVNRFDPNTGGVEKYDALVETTDNQTLPDVVEIYCGRDDVIWVGTWGSGLYEMNPDTGDFVQYYPQNEKSWENGNSIAAAICEFGEGDLLWIGTWGNGLNVLNRKNGSTSNLTMKIEAKQGLSSNLVKTICQDSKGAMWLGTINNGVCYYDPHRLQFNHYRHVPNVDNGLNNNDIFALLCDRRGGVWIGTDGGGLNHFHPETGVFTHYIYDSQKPDKENGIQRNSVISLLEADDGSIWVGNWRGYVYRLDPSTAQFETFMPGSTDSKGYQGEFFRSLCQAKDRKIWMGMETVGINVYDPASKTFHNYKPDPNDPHSLSDNYIRCIYRDSNDDIWIATNSSGLDRYDPSIDGFVHYRRNESDPHSLISNHTITIFEDRSKRLWIGSEQGLSLFHPDSNSFTHYTKHDGLPSSTIKGILQDREGYLWMSTANGISRFHPEDESFQNFDYEDGLHGVSFNSNTLCMGRDSSIYFGGVGGLNRIYLDRLSKNSNIPPVAITDFKVNGLPFSFHNQKEMQFSYRQNYFEFEFAALNYTNPRQNRYAYRMLGLEEDWRQSETRRFAQYTNLSPGRYKFQVIGSNNDGVWNETGASIGFVIHPPFWATTLFRLLVVLVALAIIVFIHHVRVRSMNKQRLQLKEEVQRQTQQLRVQSQELKQANQELKHIALIDGLTGIPNRRAFDEYCEREWIRMHQERIEASILMVDVDYFKRYNDSQGHQAGDFCLKRIASTLRSIVYHPDDLVARYGGEEFVIVLSGANAENALKAAHRLKDGVAALQIPYTYENQSKIVSISIGIATDIPSADANRNDLVHAADLALYQAKKMGRNAVVMYHSGLNNEPE